MKVVIIFFLLIPFASFAQSPGLKYQYQDPEYVDVEGVQIMLDHKASLDEEVDRKAAITYNGHIESILKYIPLDVPDGRKIAEKYIDLYHKEIGYPKNQYAMFTIEAKKFIFLVRYDIEKDVQQSYNSIKSDSLP